MKSLIQYLQEKQVDFTSFVELTKPVLTYAPNVLSNRYSKGNYDLFVAESAEATKRVRPVNRDLILWDVDEFDTAAAESKSILNQLNKHKYSKIFNKKRNYLGVLSM